jgi:hypothetical protein
MAKYLYSLVRCVPDPRTGEYVNVGAIVARADGGDWAVRRVSSDKRALKLGTPEQVAVAHAFLARVEQRLEDQLELVGEPVSVSWLDELYSDHRNVVQLTTPTVMSIDDAEAGLDLLFSKLIIDPVAQPRGYITKSRVVSDLRTAYRAHVGSDLLHTQAQVFVGNLVRAPIDVAVANGVAYQLTQAWSFQRAGVADVTTQVKAWGYAISRLKGGEEGRLLGSDDYITAVPTDVDVQVAVATPRSTEQERAFAEAQQVFADLDVPVHALDDIEAISLRAAELVAEG